jgi:hypothetical protein
MAVGRERANVAFFPSDGRVARGNAGRRKRPKVELTGEWQELLPLFAWPEQEALFTYLEALG